MNYAVARLLKIVDCGPTVLLEPIIAKTYHLYFYNFHLKASLIHLILSFVYSIQIDQPWRNNKRFLPERTTLSEILIQIRQKNNTILTQNPPAAIRDWPLPGNSTATTIFKQRKAPEFAFLQRGTLIGNLYQPFGPKHSKTNKEIVYSYGWVFDLIGQNG